MAFKDKAVSFFGWVASFGGGKLNGYRTYISIGISFILKALVGWHVIGGAADAAQLSATTNAVILIGSGVADLAAVFFRAAAATPGPLAEQAEVYKAIRLGK